jgi:hypothetical protein
MPHTALYYIKRELLDKLTDSRAFTGIIIALK